LYICDNAGQQQQQQADGEPAGAQVMPRGPAPRRVAGVRGRPARNRLAAAQPQDDSG